MINEPDLMGRVLCFAEGANKSPTVTTPLFHFHLAGRGVSMINYLLIDLFPPRMSLGFP